jgi:hypothetical protein
MGARAVSIHKAIIVVLVASGLCAAVALAPYLWAFGGWNIDSQKPELWAHFATYLSGVLGPLLAVLNLLAVVYIAVQLTQFQQADVAAKRLSLDLYNEWHAREMHDSRIKVSAFLNACQAKDEAPPALSVVEKVHKDVEADLFRIYHFYEKWALLVTERQVDTTLMQTLLGGYAAWWRDEYFADALQTESDTYMKPVLQNIQENVFASAKSKHGS